MFEDQDAGYPAHARATRESEILLLPKEAFAPFVKHHPRVAWEMLRESAGRVKELASWALLARVLVAYPVSMVIFAGFIVYQLYRFTFTHGVGLLFLSAMDVVVIGLIFLEYRALRRGRA